MNGMGQRALSDAVQTGIVNEILYSPADEFKNETIFSEETSQSVCLLKNLSTNDIVSVFDWPLVTMERECDRMEDRDATLLEGITLTEKGDPAT